jgi:serine/threonine protein kinase/Tol biopolymer transport system component
VLPGSRVGVYEIIGLLGAGGMGEVYRARDSRLQRHVALKLLPASVAADPERLARFTREAQLLAAFNHPNIAAIHGLEDSGRTPAIVMELVEGPTLADRLAEGPLDVDEAIAVARQIAEAVEFAHEQGIIHRDLKPANIKLRPDGAVKILDFGLGKMLAPAGSGSDPSGDAAQSPTLTSPATSIGTVLGTAAYMAPEQARGRAVDRRADVWAFGVVLFEMLAGQRPFGGETISEAMAAIIKDDPAWDALPQSIPSELRRLIRRALEKDPRRRLRDMGDARLALDEINNGWSSEPGAPLVAPRQRPWIAAAPWVVVAVLLAIVGYLASRGRSAGVSPSASFASAPTGSQTAESAPRQPDLPTLKYTIPIPNLQLERTMLPTLSPDGRRLAYSSGGQLWVRDLDKLDGRPLTGAGGAQFPFWSPDGQQIAYLTATALWRVALDGSAPVRIASYRFSKGGRTPGGVWRRDGTIVFAPASSGTNMLVLPASGGEFHDLFARDPVTGSDFHRPSLLPDGESLLFIVDRSDTGADTIAVHAGGKVKTILRIDGEFLDSPVYSPTGHILYHRETTSTGIWAVPFSIDKLETTGTPFLVVPQGSWPAVGANGMLVYADSELSGLEELVWLDLASGAVTPALNEKFPAINYPRLSPDGTRVTALVRSPETGPVIIVADLQRHAHVQIAERASASSRPTWRDDRSIVYAVDAGRGDIVATRRADASSPQIELFRGVQPSVGRRGGELVIVRQEDGKGGGLWQTKFPPGDLPPAEPTVLQQTPVHEWEPALSPDGTLLAYSSGDLGQSEIMLRRFPQSTGQWQVSASGGSLPVWNRAGDKLYFRDNPGQIYVVDVKTNPDVRLSAPRPIPRPASVIARTGFDLSRDGKRLLMMRTVKTDATRGPSLAVVQNWYAEFRK